MSPFTPVAEMANTDGGFGINLIGNLSGGIGLGVTTRALAALLTLKIAQGQHNSVSLLFFFSFFSFPVSHCNRLVLVDSDSRS